MDWVAAFCIIFGIYLVGRKSPYGFWWISFGACISAILQAIAALWGLAMQSVLVVFMNFWAYSKWTQEKESEQKPEQDKDDPFPPGDEGEPQFGE